MGKPIRGYLSHSIRGKYGAAATDEQMNENCADAAVFAAKVRERFPSIDLYVPGENDEFIQLAYRMGVLTEKAILDVDCELINRRDFVLAYMRDGHTSSGMLVELRHASMVGMPVIPMANANTSSLDLLAQMLLRKLR